MPTRAAIVAYARTLLNTEFKHQGRLPGEGIDCSGSIVLIGRHFNIPHEDSADYPRQADGASFQAALDRWLTRIDRSAIQPASVLFLRIGKKRPHVAVVTDYHGGGLGMLHACSNAGKVVEHVLHESWLERLVQAYDIPGVQ